MKQPYITLHMHIHSMYTHRETYQSNVWEYYVCKNVSFFQNYHPSSNSIFRIIFDSIYLSAIYNQWIFSLALLSFPPILTIGHIWHLSPRTTDTQWRHKSKISEKSGRCGRQNMLWPYLKIWEWEWIFGCAVKAYILSGRP